ncbi:acyl-CoA dehydrogenase family protein [Streptomyces albus]|uniref:acyl-CoA dehydrogenase family protein n=1 Tax=Streptomyces albus TaxID=1888 RepID=UPI000564E128|nr:acyl-CoA dehydrogenase family protein [Streptomyces albus]
MSAATTGPAPATATAAAEQPVPDLLYSEAEEDLRSAVRSLLADRCAPAAVLARIETGRPYDPDLWTALGGGMGAAGLLVPEELGGQGASAREAAVVLEELGRAAAPSPYLTSAVIAVEALLATEPVDGTEAAALLAELAGGRSTATLALPWSTAPGTRLTVTVRAGDDAALTGSVRGVADAGESATLLVPAEGPGGLGLYAVDTAASGVTVTPRVPLDLTRPLADTAFADAPARPVAGPEEAEAAIRRALFAGAGLLASEQLGLAEWCLAETVRHTRERHQFNRPVGSFQALKHRLAALWLDIVSARAAARNAADALATGSPDLPVAVAVAQAHCSRTAVHAAEECVQMHGGIGMTWEHPAHLYLKRAKADAIALGTAGRHREALAALVNLPAPSP